MYSKIKQIFQSIRKITIMIIVLFFFTYTVNAQTKKEVLILNNFLYIFPEDTGYYTYSEALEICGNINIAKSHGYNDWRLPTLFELQVMEISKIEGVKKGIYMYASKHENSFINSSSKSNVRLVRTYNNTKNICSVEENSHNPFWLSQIIMIVSSSTLTK